MVLVQLCYGKGGQDGQYPKMPHVYTTISDGGKPLSPFSGNGGENVARPT